MPPLRRLLPSFALLPLLVLTACGEPTQEELLRAATETYEERRHEVEEATAALKLREEELALAQSARDEAEERLREGKRALAEARAQVGLHATDELLFRKVQQALLEDKVLSEVAVRARVQDGVVTLTGTVTDAAMRERAIAIARDIPGIAEVNSHLTLQKSSAKDSDES